MSWTNKQQRLAEVNLLAPYSDLGLLILRIGLALVYIEHGSPKITPNSPMKGTAGVTGFFKQLGIRMSVLSAWIVALLETVGSVLLILGIDTPGLSLTRLRKGQK